MKRFFKISALLAASAAISGCMVGPDYENPDSSIGLGELDESAFKSADVSWKTAEPHDVASKGDWWKIYQDDSLDELMRRLRKDNPDLKSLFYKVEQARQNACMTRSHLYPNISGNATYIKAQQANNAVLPVLDNFDDWITGAGLTWDADLFGRVRSMLQAQRSSAESAQFEYENMLLMLQANVAQTYFALRELEAERILLEKTVQARIGEREFVEKRVNMRSAPDGDLQRAIEQEYSAKAQLTDIETQIALAKNLLALLCGTSTLKTALQTPAPLDALPPEIPQAVPSQLLERRPDIAAAERRVCAANYKIGAAQAAFFPTVSITSAVGVESSAFSKLLDAGSFAWGVSPQIYIPIFQAGRLAAQKRVALAAHKETLEKYRSTVLEAVREVEDALAKDTHLKKQFEQRRIASNAAKKVQAYTAAQYRAGVADYFAASQAHRYALANELVLMRMRGEMFRNSVALIRALGGSWSRTQAENGKSGECFFQRGINKIED